MEHSARALLQEGLQRLGELLAPVITVASVNVGSPLPNVSPSAAAVGRADDVVEVRDDRGGYSKLLVEAKSDVSPAQARTMLADRVELMRRLQGEAAVLIVSEWLSPRTRQELRRLGYGYLDLYGNVWLRLARPAVLLDKDGDQQDPRPRRRKGVTQLGGAKAGRLVRFLAEHRPPFQAQDVVRGTGLSQPYVSRLLEAVEDLALVTRRGREILEVDWRNLLIARAERADLLRINDHRGYLAPEGRRGILERLRDQTGTLGGPVEGGDLGEAVLTGSLAAEAIAPITVGGQVTLYVPARTTSSWAKALRLLGPSDDAADVVLLEPGDPYATAGRWITATGLPVVALAQLALDLLGGPARMPAEGEEILNYMAAHEDQWQTSL